VPLGFSFWPLCATGAQPLCREPNRPEKFIANHPTRQSWLTEPSMHLLVHRIWNGEFMRRKRTKWLWKRVDIKPVNSNRPEPPTPGFSVMSSWVVWSALALTWEPEQCLPSCKKIWKWSFMRINRERSISEKGVGGEKRNGLNWGKKRGALPKKQKKRRCSKKKRIRGKTGAKRGEGAERRKRSKNLTENTMAHQGICEYHLSNWEMPVNWLSNLYFRHKAQIIYPGTRPFFHNISPIASKG